MPADYATIQEAIDTAFVGDTILVANGTYVENINFNCKDVVVASNFLHTKAYIDIENTIIDRDGAASVVTLSGGETRDAQFIGFTITYGYATSGGGLYIKDASPILSHLIIRNNSVYSFDGSYGGSIFGNNTNLLLKNSLLYGNQSTAYGSNQTYEGIYLTASKGEINCGLRCKNHH